MTEPPSPEHLASGNDCIASLASQKDRLDSLLAFNRVHVTEILDQDSRPTFVIDLDPDHDAPFPLDGLTPVFCNSALRFHERLMDVINGTVGQVELNTADTYQDFRSWATGVTKHDDSMDCFPLSFIYADMLWTGSTIRKRWRLISGNLWNPGIPVCEPSPPAQLASVGPVRETSERSSAKPSVAATTTEVPITNTTLSSSEQKQRTFHTKDPVTNSSSTGDSSQTKRLVLAAPVQACPDWTVPRPKGIISDHIAIVRAVRWEDTPLGPMKKWTPEFRHVVNLVMRYPFAAALFWGAELTMIYNEAYAKEAAGHKHPKILGTGFSGPFSEVWDAVSDSFTECARTGVSIRREDEYLPVHRYGFLEETFFSWSLTPLYGGTNKILGFHNTPIDTTESVLGRRRMQTINQVGRNISQARGVKQFWKYLLEALEDNHFEIPFALLYSVGDVEDNDQASSSSGSTMSMKNCVYEGSIGIPQGHDAAPRQLDLKRSREGFIPAFREAMRAREPTLLNTRDGTLPEELLEGINWRGFQEPCNKAIIFPVRPTNGENVLAFLVIGVNPRRPYDSGYRDFTSMLNRQLAASLASCMLFEAEVRRSKDAAEAAAIESQHLSQQLALQTNRFRRMTEQSPLGMFLFDPDGILTEGNDRYYEMTGHPRNANHAMSWMEQVESSSLKDCEEGWQRMIVDHQSWSAELQMKRLVVKPVDLKNEDIEYWVVITAQPEFAPDGSIRAIMGSITDVSHMKWAEGLQNRRLQEAEETRRQQNEFIDITSHEMRNPLSAILQCADDIVATLNEQRSAGTPISAQDTENCLEAAHTISLCVQHQKSIVDDILTVSKLDSNLLVITPTPAHPVEVVKRVIKMFESELLAKDIHVVHQTLDTFKDVAIEWAIFDPSRVMQILINLVTNAIKFTAPSAIRNITVTLGASTEAPVLADASFFKYIPPKAVKSSAFNDDDWGTGELLYIRFMVQDTGCGLSPEEIKLLFTRFSQASPRTHAQYGGSGLGLFISRQLAELHGGRIGVSSVVGNGSCFGFFIAVRRTSPPTGDNSAKVLGIEGAVGGDAMLTQQVAPMRQDLASRGPPSDLVATKATRAFDPRDLDILVVEDNLVNQTVLIKQLKKRGIGVSAANDGIEALAHLDETMFRKVGGKRLSVILMDLEMPNMDGLTCVREIRRMEHSGEIHGHVPVIAVTANVREEQVDVARRSGMDDVVSKPFRIPDLLKKLEVLLEDLSPGGA